MHRKILQHEVSHHHDHLDIALVEVSNLSVIFNVLEDRLELTHVLDVYALMADRVKGAYNLTLNVEEGLPRV
jgi:hypothetical protein